MKGRLIIHGARPPADNMAIDGALLRACEEGGGRFPVLRFYWWTVPTLSLGAKERLEEAADLEACRRLGIAIVRRPTGGRAVLHHRELTYSVVGWAGRPPFTGSVVKSYRKIAVAMRDGLSRLGLKLELTPGPRRARGVHQPCFAAPSRCELAAGGRKVVGSAQRRLRRSVLQHGSILIRAEMDLLALATGLGRDGRAKLEGSMIGIEEVLAKPVTREEIIGVLVPALGASMEADLEGSDLTEQERRLGAELLRSGRYEVTPAYAQPTSTFE